MDFELVKNIIYLLTGGFLIFLSVTITRDNFVHRLNRLTGALLFFAGLGPVCVALGAVITQYPTGTVPFAETTTYGMHHIWELFFPVLLVVWQRLDMWLQSVGRYVC